MDHRVPQTTPDLHPGLTLLRRPSRRAPDVHALVAERLATIDGDVCWIDARDTASTHLLYDLVTHPGVLDDVRIARAWTAYQHHSLVRSLACEVDVDTSLVVAPAVTSLYYDDTLPDWEATDLRDSTLAILSEIADTFDVPVLVSTTPETGSARDVVTWADREIRCAKTRVGYAFKAEDFQTTVYWGDGYFQTTIPYWVELLGRADEDLGVAVDAAGLLAGEV